MNDKIRELLEEIEDIKVKLAEEIEKQESHISYEIKDGYVRFEKEVLAKQRENMKNLLNWFREVPFLHLLSSPLIYAMIIPAVLFDIILFFITIFYRSTGRTRHHRHGPRYCIPGISGRIFPSGSIGKAQQ